MTPEEADALLRGLTKFVDMYEDRIADLPTNIGDVAVVAFSLGKQSATAENDRTHIRVSACANAVMRRP